MCIFIEIESKHLQRFYEIILMLQQPKADFLYYISNDHSKYRNICTRTIPKLTLPNLPFNIPKLT